MDENQLARQRYYALVILGILLPLLLWPFLASYFLSSGQRFEDRFVVSRFIIWAEFGLIFLYARYAEIQPFFLWEEEQYSAGFYFTSVIGLFIMVFIAAIISAIPHYLGFRENNDVALQLKKLLGQHPMLLVFTAFTAGVTEETIFRAYMVPRLSLLFKNPNWPVVISALLFSSIHLSYKNVGEMIFTFTFGLICAWYYKRYRNIRALVLVHILWDVLVNLPAHYHR